MSAERFSLDTNILVYALDSLAQEKHVLASGILDRAVECDCFLTLQALSEFFAAVTRKGIVPRSEAARQVEDWLLLFPTLAPTPAAMRAALTHTTTGRASYRDALLVATAAEGGCTALLSEDLADGSRLGPVLIVNPFSAGGLSRAASVLLV
jgi:predicted nucleic acid-binding protein